ncbi:MAG TPA: GNAT family N-acetyltransferase [Enterobacteriaceae bacterium]|nr:GNAT family N-acetyltransferase [Enterobacteriaceae bacterium]
MQVRLARPDEAEKLWDIRNQAIRHGCRDSYGEEAIRNWTPDTMPEGYRRAIAANPFFVIDGPSGQPVATGFLDLTEGSVEAIFTLPECHGQGLAGRIMQAIKQEARERGYAQLTLASTPNAVGFYQRQGFSVTKEGLYPSALAQTSLRCVEMSLIL